MSTLHPAGRWAPLVTLLPAGVAIVAGIHGVLWVRLVRDVGLPVAVEGALTVLSVVLAASIPIGVVAGRLVSNRTAARWLGPIYAWIGTSFFLALAVGAMELVRLAGVPVGPRASAAMAVALGLGASVLALREARRLRIERVEVPLRKLPRALDGLRVVQISDLHVGPTLGRAFVERVVATVNGLAPDVVVVTGDLVDGSVRDLAAAVAPLADLASTYGTFFVPGNHEYHAGASAWCAHLPTLGVRVLQNERVTLAREGHALDLAGVDDYEARSFDPERGPDVARAIEGRDPTRPLILLAHQPKAARDAARHGVDLQLSGHTHGGQLWPLPWLARATQPFVSGLSKLGETFVYVSRGTGHSGPPMRLGAPPEVTLVELRAVA